MPSGSTLQLVRVERNVDAILWSFRADSSGRFVVENVPHGRYRVQIAEGTGSMRRRSEAFDVGDGRNEVTVEWPTG
jgi:hypothetical protein